MRVIQAFARERRARERFDEVNADNRDSLITAMSLSFIFLPTVEFLGVLATAILAFTIPAYFDTTFNPALEDLPGDLAGLGSVAGAFLSRQVALASVALIGAIRGARPVVAIGLAVFNSLDAVFIAAAGDGGRGAVAGLVFGVAAIVVIVATARRPHGEDDTAASA